MYADNTWVALAIECVADDLPAWRAALAARCDRDGHRDGYACSAPAGDGPGTHGAHDGAARRRVLRELRRGTGCWSSTCVRRGAGVWAAPGPGWRRSGVRAVAAENAAASSMRAAPVLG